MKKSLIFACAAAALLASCSQDQLDLRDGWGLGGNEVADDGTPQQIKLGASLSATVATRGTGTVGGVLDGNGNYTQGTTAHEWNSEHFNVFMFKKGTITLTQNPEVVDDKGTGLFYVLNDKEYVAPPSGAGYATDIFTDNENWMSNANYAYAKDGEVSYYPTQDAHDFWAYRLDGTAKALTDGVAFAGSTSLYTETEVDETGAGVLNVDFAIEGNNDIMVAKAEPIASQRTKMEQLGAGFAETRLWSAYAARQGVQPVLTFDHMLTRLTFRIIDSELQAAYNAYLGGDKDAKYGKVKVDDEKGDTESKFIVTDIRVFSKTDGTLVVAYDNSNAAAYQSNIKRINFEDFGGDLADGAIATKDVRSNYYEYVVKPAPTAPSYALPLQARKDGSMVSLMEGYKFDPELEGTGAPDGGYRPVAGTQEEEYVGEALIVYPEPEENKYYVVFQLMQEIVTERDYGYDDATGKNDYDPEEDDNKYDSPVDGPKEWKPYTVHGEITLPDGEQFKQGWSYTVNVSLHGLEEIEIYVDATPWVDGGETDIDPDEDNWKPLLEAAYTISFDAEALATADGNGSAKVSGYTTIYDEEDPTLEVEKVAAEGQIITVVFTPNEGYEPESITIGSETIEEGFVKKANGKYEYSFPATAAMVTRAEEEKPVISISDVTFKKIDYTVKAATAYNGKFSVQKTAQFEDEVVVTCTSDEGYELKDVTVSYKKNNRDEAVEVQAGENGNEKKFTMPSADVTVTVTFQKTVEP